MQGHLAEAGAPNARLVNEAVVGRIALHRTSSRVVGGVEGSPALTRLWGHGLFNGLVRFGSGLVNRSFCSVRTTRALVRRR